jgi:hypothetical protein
MKKPSSHPFRTVEHTYTYTHSHIHNSTTPWLYFASSSRGSNKKTTKMVMKEDSALQHQQESIRSFKSMSYLISLLVFCLGLVLIWPGQTHIDTHFIHKHINTSTKFRLHSLLAFSLSHTLPTTTTTTISSFLLEGFVMCLCVCVCVCVCLCVSHPLHQQLQAIFQQLNLLLDIYR